MNSRRLGLFLPGLATTFLVDAATSAFVTVAATVDGLTVARVLRYKAATPVQTPKYEDTKQGVSVSSERPTILPVPSKVPLY